MLNKQLFQSLEQKKQYKYPFFFFAFYLTFLLATVCLANRFTMVGAWLEPGGIFIFPMTFTICDIVGEVYGYAYPRLFIWLGIFSEFIFAFVNTIVSHLPFPNFFHTSFAYQIVFDPTLRYVSASFVSFITGEFVNIYLLTKWKVLLKGRLFILRSLASTALGQACLTVIVDTLNYSGKLDHKGMLWLMFCGYVWKMVYAIIMAFPAWAIVQVLKKIENVDYYDVNTNFNPFVISLNQQNNLNE